MSHANLRSLALVNAMVALWIVFTGNLSFFEKLLSLTPFDDWRAAMFISSAVILLWAYINFALQWVTWGGFARPVLTFILLASAMTAFFVDTYGVGIDGGQIQNMMETDFHEVMDLLSWHMLGYIVVLAGLPIFWLWRRPLTPENIWSRQRTRLFSSLISVLLVGAVALVFFADYASIFRNHREVRLLINPQNYVAGLRSYFRRSLPTQNEPLTLYGQDAHRLKSELASSKPVLMVLVVGETARAESFGINGHHRDTTPELIERRVMSFTQVSSCGTATAVSLPCMFSGFARRDYDEGQAKTRENLLDILQRAGYQVTWIDNNSGCKGVCDRIAQQPVLASKSATRCKEDKCHDDILADTLETLLQHSPVRDQVIVLHQLGSHGPTYYKRYPDAFRRFQPTCDTNELQRCTQEQVVNTYDNTIAYTDHVLARVIDILQAQEGRYRPAFWYVSDHGESTGEKGLYLHGAPYLFAPSQQTHIPMLAWLSPGFTADQRMSCIRSRQHAELSHDNLFHTMLGLLKVGTDVYRPELDIGACPITQALSGG